MKRSSPDMLGLVAEIQTRMERTLSARARRKGGTLELTERQQALLVTARTVHHRFLQGDYRHGDNEEGLLLELAAWLIAEHAANLGRGAAPKTFEIDRDGLSVKSDDEMPRRGMYQQATLRSASGWPGLG